MNKIKKGALVIGGFALGVIAVVVVNNSFATDNEPGTISDPLVSKSYLDEQNAQVLSQVEAMFASFEEAEAETEAEVVAETVADAEVADLIYMEELYSYVDDKFTDIEVDGIEIVTTEGAASFEVILLKTGEKLICDESAEIILRSGEAIGIDNGSGDGLSDVTVGIDVEAGDSVVKNHLLIVPRTDGRGIEAVKGSYVMIKGTYEIQ